MKKHTLALWLVLVTLSGLLVLPAQAAEEKNYLYVLQGMIDESQEVSEFPDYEYPEGGYGALYDLNGDGIQELLTVHWRSDDLNGGAALYATLFTLSSGNSIPILAIRERLFVPAGMSSGFSGIVQKDAHTYFCTFSEEGDGELFIQEYRLYTLSDTTAVLAERSRVQYREGEPATYLLNDTAVSQSEYDAWTNRISEVLSLSPNSSGAKGLSSLLRQIDSLPEDTQPPAPPNRIEPDVDVSTSGPAVRSGMDNFTPLYSYHSGLYWDVEPSDWFWEYAARAYELGLMNGTGNGGFDPHSNVTIAQAITLSARIHSIYHTGSDQFPAAASGQWYAPYVVYARDNGIPAYFPDMQIPATRDEFAYILSAALPAQELPELPSNPWVVDFFDYSSCAYTDAIDLLTRAGVIHGIQDIDGALYFEPYTYIDRASVAAIVTRMADPAFR